MMALTLFSGSNRVVNLVLKDHVIRYVELKQLDPPIVQKCGEHFLPAGVIKDGIITDFDLLKDILSDCVTKWKIHKRQVRFLVPDSRLVIRKVPIPKDIKEDEIRGYLYLEMGTSIHLPFEEPVFDIVLLDETEEKKEILLFAAQEEVVSEYAALLEKSQLYPIEADISPLSLYRLFYHAEKRSLDDHLLLIEFNLQTVNTSIFVDDKPIFMKNIPITGTSGEWEASRVHTDKEIMVFTGDTEDYMQLLEDTYTEIDRVLSFYQYTLSHEQHQVTKIVVTGDHPFLDEVTSDIKKRYEQTVMTIPKGYIQSNKEPELPESFYLAGGLALKGVR